MPLYYCELNAADPSRVQRARCDHRGNGRAGDSARLLQNDVDVVIVERDPSRRSSQRGRRLRRMGAAGRTSISPCTHPARAPADHRPRSTSGPSRGAAERRHRALVARRDAAAEPDRRFSPHARRRRSAPFLGRRATFSIFAPSRRAASARPLRSFRPGDGLVLDTTDRAIRARGLEIARSGPAR